MQGKFVEGQRWALNRMFRYMKAYGLPWDVMWEVAQEQSQSWQLNDQMLELERSTTRREQRSINAALRKEGFTVRFEYLPDNYYEE